MLSSFLHTYISGEASEHDCWWHRDHTNASIGEDFCIFSVFLFQCFMSILQQQPISVIQVRAVFRDPEDTTCLSLLFANQTEDDILLR